MPAYVLTEDQNTRRIAQGGAVDTTGCPENLGALLELLYHGKDFKGGDGNPGFYFQLTLGISNAVKRSPPATARSYKPFE